MSVITEEALTRLLRFLLLVWGRVSDLSKPSAARQFSWLRAVVGVIAWFTTVTSELPVIRSEPLTLARWEHVTPAGGVLTIKSGCHNLGATAAVIADSLWSDVGPDAASDNASIHRDRRRIVAGQGL